MNVVNQDLLDYAARVKPSTILFWGDKDEDTPLWMGQKLNPEVPLYNMVHVFTISGDIDIESFKRAFRKLVENSDALRTVFYEDNNKPFQRVLNTVDYEMDYFDFSDYDESRIKEWVNERSQIKFLSIKSLDLTLSKEINLSILFFSNSNFSIF